jgi:hypothetical protein
LVFFHNHGSPGAGVYLPKTWHFNRAEWHHQGITVPDAQWSSSLVSMPDEGLYAVQSAFFCCDKQCVRFEVGQLVQLGYDGEAAPIVFVPEWTARGLLFPEQGSRVEESRLGALRLLKVAQGRDVPKHALMH